MRKKEGKLESLTLSDGQYYSENIFPESKDLAAEMAKLPLLSMLVPKRVFVHRNKIFLDEVHVDMENVPSQIICATEASRETNPLLSRLLGNKIPRKDSHSKQSMRKFRSRGIYNAEKQ